MAMTESRSASRPGPSPAVSAVSTTDSASGVSERYGSVPVRVISVSSQTATTTAGTAKAYAAARPRVLLLGVSMGSVKAPLGNVRVNAAIAEKGKTQRSLPRPSGLGSSSAELCTRSSWRWTPPTTRALEAQ